MPLKHCHFSILYNELEFLKQKLPFLYEHFHQLIFYDLNSQTCTPSTDGSREYIKSFPDPQHKITLIEKNNLNDIKNYKGSSSIIKRKMFAVGSKYVRDDIDAFWCTDLDEFFDVSLLRAVEDAMNKNPKVNVFNTPHHIFFKNFDVVFAKGNNNRIRFDSLARIARHKVGNVYGHCPVLPGKQIFLDGDGSTLLHFSYVGYNRVFNKLLIYNKNTKEARDYLNNIYLKNKFIDTPLKGKCHPNKKLGFTIVPFDVNKIPKYINRDELFKDLYNINQETQNLCKKLGIKIPDKM